MILSIIIPAYKVESYIEKCILSCLNQDLDEADYEIIVVNDGSPDRSSDIAKQIALKNTNIQVIDRPNGGLSVARNTGMKAARGDYYFFVDSDDWIENNCLGEICRKLQSEEPDILYIGAADNFEGLLRRRNIMRDIKSKKGRDALLSGIRPEAQLSITKASFMRLHNFSFMEGVLHEDSELTPRMYYFASKVAFHDKIVYNFYPNQQSITRSVNPRRSFDIIQHVCTSLSDFVDTEVDSDYKIVFHKIISMCINNAIAYSKGGGSDYVTCLNKIIYDNRYLYKHLWLSRKIKYMLEFILFSVVPHRTIQIYNLLTM